jgi:hypothetical protein
MYEPFLQLGYLLRSQVRDAGSYMLALTILRLEPFVASKFVFHQ